MDPLLMLLLGLLIGLLLGFALGWLLRAQRRGGSTGADADSIDLLVARHENEVTSVKAAEAALRAELQSRIAALEVSESSLREQLQVAVAQHREATEARKLEFAERLAAQDELYKRQSAQQEERLAEFQKRLAELREAEAARAKEDGKVLVALSPVAESLQSVQKKVAELEEQRATQYGALQQQLRVAAESEERLRSTAESLASALRSNSTRGVWGETQLRNVVQAAGLLERVDFDVQSSITADEAARRPDMVIHLPGGKNIAVDAKVPFSAYLEASQIPATASGDDLARRTALMKEHVKALRSHIDQLSLKNYWSGLDASPELTIAFIPSEALVSSALEADPAIMDYAFGKRVALASPVSLWSVLKTVAFSWQQDVVTQEAKMLFDLSRELYSRLGTMASHVDKLGRSLRGSVTDYNKFVGSLERQVLPSARRLSLLDESKVIGAATPVEEQPRELTAVELTDSLRELDAAGDETAPRD